MWRPPNKMLLNNGYYKNLFCDHHILLLDYKCISHVAAIGLRIFLSIQFILNISE